MNIKFKWIAILGHPRHKNFFLTHTMLYKWLIEKGYHVFIEYSISKFLNVNNVKSLTFTEIGEQCDLGIVIGGDGNMLYISKILSYYPIKIIGVNCGNLGFLTDLYPKNMFSILSNILNGDYILEKRFLLEVVVCNKKVQKKNFAVNEIMIHTKNNTCMIDFEVYFDNQFAFYQRSDGLILSTPTGSTGYSLSAGGPIVSISSEVISVIPILPHTLSSRPIIINNNNLIMIKIFKMSKNINVTCDSQIIIPIDTEQNILVYKSKYFINLIHPKTYHYLNVLQKKLNWFKNFF